MSLSTGYRTFRCVVPKFDATFATENLYSDCVRCGAEISRTQNFTRLSGSIHYVTDRLMFTKRAAAISTEAAVADARPMINGFAPVPVDDPLSDVASGGTMETGDGVWKGTTSSMRTAKSDSPRLTSSQDPLVCPAKANRPREFVVAPRM